MTLLQYDGLVATSTTYHTNIIVTCGRGKYDVPQPTRPHMPDCRAVLSQPILAEASFDRALELEVRGAETYFDVITIGDEGRARAVLWMGTA